jgi:hypothetical protein
MPPVSGLETPAAINRGSTMIATAQGRATIDSDSHQPQRVVVALAADIAGGGQ